MQQVINSRKSTKSVDVLNVFKIKNNDTEWYQLTSF